MSILALVASTRGGAFSATSTSLPERISACRPVPGSWPPATADDFGQDPVDDFDRSFVGDAVAVDKAGRQIFLPHGRGDRLAAAVDDDGIDAHGLQENDVAHDAFDEVGVFHRGAAILDHGRCAREIVGNRQRFEKRVRLAVSHHSPLLIRTYSSVRSVVRMPTPPCRSGDES